MSTINPSMTLAEIVTLQPKLAADLERFGLDYCCHGARTLDAAATELGIDPQTVADELSALRVDEPPADWASLTPAELVDHIEQTHHHYLWDELPRATALVDKIVAVHGERHPELAEVKRIFDELRADFEPHLTLEERDVFPLVRQLGDLDTDGTSTATSRDRSELSAQIGRLTAEHETVGELFEQLRAITGAYSAPADGCATYVACFQSLADLEADTHMHVHKENNVLFPSVVDGSVAAM